VQDEPVEARPPQKGTPVVHLHCKVVPGASRNAVAGVLGDRLKVAVTAPPESGRANKAVLAFLAGALGLPKSALRVVRGPGTPLKTIEVRGLEAADVGRLLYGEPR
jgi:uncharacterized protein (TIGR00251 family)